MLWLGTCPSQPPLRRSYGALRALCPRLYYQLCISFFFSIICLGGDSIGIESPWTSLLEDYMALLGCFFWWNIQDIILLAWRRVYYYVGKQHSSRFVAKIKLVCLAMLQNINWLGDLGLLIHMLNDFLEVMIHLSSNSLAFPQKHCISIQILSGYCLLLTLIIAHQKTTFKHLSIKSESVRPSSARHKMLLRN